MRQERDGALDPAPRSATPPGRIESGNVEFEGKDLLALSEREMRDVRGDPISMIFQEPMTSLNPVYTVGWQIVEGYRLHQEVAARGAGARRRLPCCTRGHP